MLPTRRQQAVALVFYVAGHMSYAVACARMWLRLCHAATAQATTDEALSAQVVAALTRPDTQAFQAAAVETRRRIQRRLQLGYTLRRWACGSGSWSRTRKA